MDKIGIIGLGFVGNAVYESYKDNPEIDLVLIDNDPAKNCNGTYEDLEDASAIFICVPSPMFEDGSCNSKPLTSTMAKLRHFKGVIISKVTAPPNVYEYLEAEHCNLVHAPEFLTAANAVQDYLKGEFLILGGSVKAFVNEAERIIRLGQVNIKNKVVCSAKEASLSKYIINSFLATKVVFMNEMKQLADQSGIDWNNIKRAITLDSKRLGTTHTQVPGPDGCFGFGGACFPKDTSAILKYAETLNIQMNVLDSAVKKNTLLRLTNSK